MITQSCDTDVSDRSLELDERMGFVVRVRWACLAAGTEVSIVADSTLVSVALDKGLMTVSAIAERSVTVDAVVASLGSIDSGQDR